MTRCLGSTTAPPGSDCFRRCGKARRRESEPARRARLPCPCKRPQVVHHESKVGNSMTGSHVAGSLPSDWAPVTLDSLLQPNLCTPLLNAHPLRLACLGDVLTWRSRAGFPAEAVDLTGLDLYNSEAESYYEKANRATGATPRQRLSHPPPPIRREPFGFRTNSLDSRVSPVGPGRVWPDGSRGASSRRTEHHVGGTLADEFAVR